jgi:hypothetical protein
MKQVMLPFNPLYPDGASVSKTAKFDHYSPETTQLNSMFRK